MNNISSISELRAAIVKLEAEQEVKGQFLRQQFQLTYESFKPVNILKSAVHDISSTPHLTSKLVGVSAGLGLGYLTRKLVIGATGSIYVKVLGSIVQLGVTNLIARHSAKIESITRFVKKSLLGRRIPDADEQ